MKHLMNKFRNKLPLRLCIFTVLHSLCETKPVLEFFVAKSTLENSLFSIDLYLLPTQCILVIQLVMYFLNLKTFRSTIMEVAWCIWYCVVCVLTILIADYNTLMHNILLRFWQLFEIILTWLLSKWGSVSLSVWLIYAIMRYMQLSGIDCNMKTGYLTKVVPS